MFLAYAGNVKAQAGTYSFAASSGTFTPIVGDSNLSSVEADSYISSAQSIGFNFDFEGITYTQFKMSSNGIISFNMTGTSNLTGNDLDNVAANSRPLLAPLWDDHDGNSGSAAPSKAGYVVTGTAPNRVLTVEWLNWEWNYASSDAVISFQVKLYETTNVIEFVYRQDADAVNNASASIGITGVSSFLSLSSSGAAPTVSNSVEVTNINTKPATGQIYTFTPPTCPSLSAITSTVLSSDSAELTWTYGGTPLGYGYEYGVSGFTLGSGTQGATSATADTLAGLAESTTYDVYFRVLCAVGDTSVVSGPFSFTTPASCPDVNAISFVTPSSDSSIMSWTYMGSPLGFGYEYGVSGFAPGTGAGTIGTTAALSDTLTGLLTNTTYDVYMRVLCAVGDTSVVSGPFTFTTPCAIATIPYLQDFSTWPPSCWDLTGGSHSFINASGVARANFWSISSGDLFMSTEQILVSANARLKFDWSKNSSTSYNDSAAVQVKTTTGAWTTVWGGSSLASNDGAGNTSPGSFVTETIILDSATYTNKVIQIRVIGVSDWGPDFFIDNVIVEPIPNCPEPLMLSAFNIASTTSDVSWSNTAGSATFRLEYGMPGFTLGTGTSSIETNDTVSLTGLSAFTAYEFYVTSICTATDSSPWVGPYSFTTLCNDTNMGPWMDDVEGHPSATTSAGISNCWSSTNSGSYEWEISNSGTTGSSGTGPLSANSGSNFFYTEASSGSVGDTAILNTPSIDLSTLTLPTLDFYYHMFGNQIGTLNVEVYDGTTWTNELTITGAQQATQASAWIQQYVDLSAYSGVIKLRFIAISNGTYEGDISLDDISVDEAPTCTQPIMVMAAGTLNDTTTVSWSAPAFGTPAMYYVEYGPTGFAQGTGTVDSTTTTMYGVGGLIGATDYDFYIVTYCGAADSSDWVGPISFTTLCDPIIPTYSEDFATYLPTCWEEANGVLAATSNVVSGGSDWKSDGFANVGSSGAVSMNIWSTGKNEWIISAPIDLGDGSIPYQVEYDVALTDYSSTSTDAMGADDTLALVISTDFGQTWSSANILRNYVSGDEPSNAGNREFIDLTGYTGIVKFGFYAASTVSNADYDVHIDNFLVTDLCVPTAVSYTDTACGTYTSPSGKIWTTAGVYNDTLQMVRGCDSVITVNLVVFNTTATVTTTVCDSYTAPSGLVYTTSGMYMDTIPNSLGCDSIISINLTVNYTASVTNTLTVCDSYTLPSGAVVVISGNYVDTITTSLGCDSIVTTQLTVNYTTSSSISEVACGTYTSPSGKVWTTSGTRFDTIPNATGCDSLMTINLTVKAVSAETRTITTCDSYTVPETGNTYYTSGTYTDVTTNSFGCPHTITTILTINAANAGTITVSGITLTSTATGVKYKWVDCNNNFSFLLKDTMQSFTPLRNGSYACLVTTTDGCKDTTTCVDINSVSLDEYAVTEKDINIFPNPASDFVNIEILNQNSEEEVEVRLFDTKGTLVYSENVNSNNNKVTFDVSKLAEGVYTVTVFNDFFSTSKKITVVK